MLNAQFKLRRVFPTPRLSADDYYRMALVPSVVQAQAGISGGFGDVGNWNSAARLVKTPIGAGMTEYSLVFKRR